MSQASVSHPVSAIRKVWEASLYREGLAKGRDLILLMNSGGSHLTTLLVCLVDSHRHIEVQRQWNHLDYVHKSYFLSQVHKAVCKIRGMLTSTVLSVQEKSFERKFFAQHKVMFLIISCTDSDAFWPKLLPFTIQFCMVYLKCPLFLQEYLHKDTYKT